VRFGSLGRHYMKPACYLLMICWFVVGGWSLPSGMIGNWQGSPNFSVLGPWGSNLFNFSIASVNGSDSVWLMSDYFEPTNPFMDYSQQQFWVEEGVGLAYCGMARNFWAVPAPIFVNFTQSSISDNQIQWCWEGCENGASWTLTLVDQNTLNSHLLLFTPVNHLNVTFKRIEPFEHSILAMDQPGPCNLTTRTLPDPPHPINNPMDLNMDELRALCPHASKMSHKAKESPKQEDWERRRSSFAQVPSRLIESYEFCYILNPAVEFALAWNFDLENSQLEVAMSMPSENANDIWLGLGFQPEFPGMIGADVALGYMTQNGDCVRSMYVPYYVGAPLDDSSMPLKGTNVQVDDSRLTVEFSRAFDSGHHNITTQPGVVLPSSVFQFTIMWASGPAPSSCSDSPFYHNENRGVRIIDWEHPARIFDSYMKCS